MIDGVWIFERYCERKSASTKEGMCLYLALLKATQAPLKPSTLLQRLYFHTLVL
jgi:hypothetical protein